MLRLAVEAQLPLIAVTTRDELNLHKVLSVITGKVPVLWEPNSKLVENTLYMFSPPPKVELPLLELYNKFTAIESTLLLVNPPQIKEPMYNAGEVPVPKEAIHELMTIATDDPKKAKELLRGLGGVTMKEAAELARLTMARDVSLTVDGIMETRRSGFMGANGLTPVDSKQGFYDPPKELVEWANREKSFFLESNDPRLIPRGLLFNGPPGTGKTSGAKWLAEKLGVPLYRMDIGGTKSKWVGESEAQLLTNLRRLDNEAPAIVLFDEIEKVFSNGNKDSSGTTATMLSQLLWWLAERRSRILVVMTTNNASALPRELYREGRVDEVFWMTGLREQDARKFAHQLLATFKPDFQLQLATTGENNVVDQVMKKTPPIPETIPQLWAHAALTKGVYTAIKNLPKVSSKGKAA